MGVVEVRSKMKGQSILEFLIMLPIMISLIYILIRTNTAIQMSIVNQQFARQHVLFVTMNHPAIFDRARQKDYLHRRQSLLEMGVAENPVNSGLTASSGPATASSVKINRVTAGKAKSGPTGLSDDAVYIRTTAALCAPNLLDETGTYPVPTKSYLLYSPQYKYCMPEAEK